MKKDSSLSVFYRVDIKRRGLEVADQILDAVRRGALKPGERLPPERELAEQTGVSRPSVREGLSALHLLGVLETRAGEGTFVAPSAMDLAVLPDILNDLRKGEVVIALEARRVLEKAAAELMIRRSTPETVREVEEVLARLRDAAERKDFPAYSRANTEFHAALARASGNPILERALMPLVNIMLDSLAQELRLRRYDSDPSFFHVNYAVHEEVSRALAAGDLGRLVAAIDGHYDMIERSL